MKIKTLNTDAFQKYKGSAAVLLIQLLGSVTYRVLDVPEKYRETGQYQDIVDLLNTYCTTKKNGIWYIPVKQKEELDDVVLTLFDTLNVDIFYLNETIQKHGYDGRFNPVPEILN